MAEYNQNYALMGHKHVFFLPKPGVKDGTVVLTQDNSKTLAAWRFKDLESKRQFVRTANNMALKGKKDQGQTYQVSVLYGVTVNEYLCRHSEKILSGEK